MSTFNPQRIADLFLRFYNVLLDMNAFPQDHLQLPPHNPAIDVSKCTALGIAPEVIDLLERLPYWRDPHGIISEHAIGPEMLSLDVFTQDKLQVIRDPNDLGTNELDRIGNYIEPWSMVIAMAQYRESSWMILNTKLNTITEVNWSYRTALVDPLVGVNSWCYDTQYGRPTEDVIEGWIQKYLDLEWIPGLDIEGSLNPIHSTREHYKAIRDLYLSHGWPSSFRREEFLSALATLKKEIYVIKLQEKEAKYPGYRERRLWRENQARDREEREQEQE